MPLSDADRAKFAALADRLIPAYGRMPAASAVDVQHAMLDLALQSRPDLAEDFSRGLAACSATAASESINALFRQDHTAFAAVNLMAVAAYYMSDVVRRLIGYPGQESPPYDPHETPGYLVDGSLERVVRRGTLYRPTPR
jgi:hypothetical protein